MVPFHLSDAIKATYTDFDASDPLSQLCLHLADICAYLDPEEIIRLRLLCRLCETALQNAHVDLSARWIPIEEENINLSLHRLLTGFGRRNILRVSYYGSSEGLLQVDWNDSKAIIDATLEFGPHDFNSTLIECDLSSIKIMEKIDIVHSEIIVVSPVVREVRCQLPSRVKEFSLSTCHVGTTFDLSLPYDTIETLEIGISIKTTSQVDLSLFMRLTRLLLIINEADWSFRDGPLQMDNDTNELKAPRMLSSLALVCNIEDVVFIDPLPLQTMFKRLTEFAILGNSRIYHRTPLRLDTNSDELTLRLNEMISENTFILPKGVRTLHLAVECESSHILDFLPPRIITDLPFSHVIFEDVFPPFVKHYLENDMKGTERVTFDQMNPHSFVRGMYLLEDYLKAIPDAILRYTVRKPTGLVSAKRASGNEWIIE